MAIETNAGIEKCEIVRRRRRRWSFGQQAMVLLLVVMVDGALFGTAAGVMKNGMDGKAKTMVGKSSMEDGQTDRVFEAAGEAEGKVVALTFDDGPHETCTAELLDGLKERGVKVTFFLMGQSIEGNEELVRRMQQEGHLIGNHSYRHIQLTKAGEERVCDAVEQTGTMIEEITGIRPQYLRPPYGDWNDRLECRLDLTTVFWSVDSLDWKLKDTGRIVDYVEKRVRSGDIVLMHDIFPTSVEAALELIDDLKEQGYQFVTVEELLID